MPKVSVIIPVYNVEKYLKESLDSLVKQTLQDIEIICIDDGSTDSSGDILKEYEKNDNRITIITQENKGQGDARNKGIEKYNCLGVFKIKDLITLVPKNLFCFLAILIPTILSIIFIFLQPFIKPVW